MVFFRETPRSLRAYLLLVGTLGTVAQFFGVLSPNAGAFGRLLSMIGLAIALANLWLGISFRSLISAALAASSRS